MAEIVKELDLEYSLRCTQKETTSGSWYGSIRYRTSPVEIDLTELVGDSNVTRVQVTVRGETNYKSWFYVDEQRVTPNENTTVEVEAGKNVSFMIGMQAYGTSTKGFDKTGKMKILSVRAYYGASASDKPAPPAKLTLSASSCKADETVVMKWEGAASTDDNPITGYRIECCDSADGITWGQWTVLQEAESTATSGQLSVPPSTNPNNPYRKYRIATKCTQIDRLYSTYTEANTVLFTLGTGEDFVQQPVSTMPPYIAVNIWRRVK